jgi:hypothetical protein
MDYSNPRKKRKKSVEVDEERLCGELIDVIGVIKQINTLSSFSSAVTATPSLAAGAASSSAVPSTSSAIIEKYYSKYYVLITLGEIISLIKKHQNECSSSLLLSINLDQQVNFGPCLNGVSRAGQYPIEAFTWLRNALTHGHKDEQSEQSWLSIDPVEIYEACADCFAYFISIVDAEGSSSSASHQSSKRLQHQLPDPKKLVSLRQTQPKMSENDCICAFQEVIRDVDSLLLQATEPTSISGAAVKAMHMPSSVASLLPGNVEAIMPDVNPVAPSMPDEIREYLRQKALNGALMKLANFFVEEIEEKKIISFFIKNVLYPRQIIPEQIVFLFKNKNGNRTRNLMAHFITAEQSEVSEAKAKLTAVNGLLLGKLQEKASLSSAAVGASSSSLSSTTSSSFPPLFSSSASILSTSSSLSGTSSSSFSSSSLSSNSTSSSVPLLSPPSTSIPGPGASSSSSFTEAFSRISDTTGSLAASWTTGSSSSSSSTFLPMASASLSVSALASLPSFSSSTSISTLLSSDPLSSPDPPNLPPRKKLKLEQSQEEKPSPNSISSASRPSGPSS